MKEVRKKTGAHGDPVELAVALSAAQEQQAQLEQTLSSETKVKMDLFSALGGARRQLQINESEYPYYSLQTRRIRVILNLLMDPDPEI
jgi:hypothetical protein